MWNYATVVVPGTWYNITSLVLGAGTWAVTALLLDTNTGGAITAAISGVSGSGVDLSPAQIGGGTGASTGRPYIIAVVVTVSANTTIYLNAKSTTADYTLGYMVAVQTG
jgi:hypothetical protein